MYTSKRQVTPSNDFSSYFKQQAQLMVKMMRFVCACALPTPHSYALSLLHFPTFELERPWSASFTCLTSSFQWVIPLASHYSTYHWLTSYQKGFIFLSSLAPFQKWVRAVAIDCLSQGAQSFHDRLLIQQPAISRRYSQPKGGFTDERVRFSPFFFHEQKVMPGGTIEF